MTWARCGPGQWDLAVSLEDPVPLFNLSDEVQHLLTDNIQDQGDPIRSGLEIPSRNVRRFWIQMIEADKTRLSDWWKSMKKAGGSS